MSQIRIDYMRIPKSDKYRTTITITKYNQEEIASPNSFDALTMKDIITKLSAILVDYPTASVVMVQHKQQDFGKFMAKPIEHNISRNMIDLIKNNLDEALVHFSPKEFTR